jgi:hypothetical protein
MVYKKSDLPLSDRKKLKDSVENLNFIWIFAA